MPANLENSAVATGLEKGSFHSNPKVGLIVKYNFRVAKLVCLLSKLFILKYNVQIRKKKERKAKS